MTSSQKVFDFKSRGCDLVNTLYSEVSDNVTIPFRFICITDNPVGLHSDIETYCMPAGIKNMESTWRKLILYSDRMRDIAGDRFCYMDMDIMVVRDITEFIRMKEPMIVTRFYKNGIRRIKKSRKSIKKVHMWELFNSCFMIMNTGIYKDVWNSFDMRLSKLSYEKKPGYLRRYFGCDQSWAAHKLHSEFDRNKIKCVGPGQGIYVLRHLREQNWRQKLPENARLVAFGGKDHPSSEVTREQCEWIKQYRPSL